MTIDRLISELQAAKPEQLDQGETEVRVWLDEGAEDNAGVHHLVSDERGVALILEIEG